MCGITGYWAREAEPAAWQAGLAASVRSLQRRGPDGSGTWSSLRGDVGLGHTRLSILDLSDSGRQPMATADGRYVMVFNGEVYNFAEIRADLEKAGHGFRSSGDSEVVLAALREWGMAAVDRFIGMFAIALWDAAERRLWLIRDRMGVKPLYYAWDGRSFWFGSELKALRAFGAWRAELNNCALAEYFQFGYISAPLSAYRRVSKLLPGHWLELRATGEPAVRPYWAPPEREPVASSERELTDQLESLLTSAFRYRMVSDVPVGVFLSGGIDSSLVAAVLQRRAGGEVHTFTVGFDEPGYDESRWAREVARHLGTRHTERVLSPADGEAILAGWGELFDEPFGDSSGVPTLLVSRAARESVKVALSADGGDELFGGYGHYGVILERARWLERVPQEARQGLSTVLGTMTPAALERACRWLPGGLGHAARRLAVDRLEKLRLVLPQVERARLYDLSMSMWLPGETSELLGDFVTPRPQRARGQSLLDHMTRCDLRHYLPDDILTKVDRTTMSVGLEGREPLLDHRVVEFALRLPERLRRGALGPKHLLRKVLYRHVPRSLIDRPKQGFSMPVSRWLRGRLAPLLDDYLAPERIRRSGVLNPRAVSRTLANFRQGGAARDRLDTEKVWLLLAFEMWRSRWGGAPPPAEKAAAADAGIPSTAAGAGRCAFSTS